MVKLSLKDTDFLTSTFLKLVGNICVWWEMSLWGNKCNWRRLIKSTSKNNGLLTQRIWTSTEAQAVTINSQPLGFEPLNSCKTWLQLYKCSFKGKTRTGLSPGGKWSRFYWNMCSIKYYLFSFFPHLWCDVSPKLRPRTAKLCPFNNALPSYLPSLFLCHFLSSLNTHPSPPPPFALRLPWQQQHCTIHLLKTWAPVPVERVCASHIYT